MLKNARKYIYWLICTLFLLGMVWLCLRYDTPDPNAVRFRIEHESVPTEITLFDAGDGNAYVFLPSYADLDSLTIVTDGHTRASLGGVAISDGMVCGDFLFETPYDLVIGNRYRTTLQFYRSANVAALYISTGSGKMDYIHQDKNYSESATVSLVADDGTPEHIELTASLKGRGNATWNYAKRPYNLTLSSEADLLGMGAAVNWTLLANALDETNLNTKIVMDLANQVGLPWSPECAYVDLYLNGEYSGLYLLTEKVEVGPSRLDIDTAAGDFLCNLDLSSRWDIMRNPFLTQAGRAIEITAPDSLSDFEKINIQNQVQKLEEIIMASPDLAAEECFDLDSWARRYLIDEISGNIDADLTSSYFYYADGVFYAGPIWDYDMSFGNSHRNQNPRSFVARNLHKSITSISHYYDALYANPTFRSRMIELYQSEFLPLLNELESHGIADAASNIQDAAAMNVLRWQTMYQMLRDWNNAWNKDSVHSTDALMTYFRERVSFLNSAWLDGTEYCTLQFSTTHDRPYWNASVEKGTMLETNYLDTENTVWINDETGEIFDPRKPIESDARFTQKPIETPAKQSPKPLTTRDYIVILSIAGLMALLACIAFIDIRQRQKERKLTNERTRA